MSAANLIKEARLRVGLSQAALAARLDTSQPVIARWEAGDAVPSFDRVQQVLRVMGFDLPSGLVPYDDSDDSLIAQQLELAPAERLRSLLDMLEGEVVLAGARRV